MATRKTDSVAVERRAPERETVEITSEKPAAPEEETVTMTRAEFSDLVQHAADEAVRRIAEGDDRLTRNQEQRGAESIHDEYDDMWDEPLNLDASKIPPRAGYHQRWVRTMLEDKPDHGNVAKSMNKGYRPRMADTAPKGVVVSKTNWEDQTNIIGIHGMILMERPLEIHERYERAKRRRTKEQMQAVDNDLMREDEGAKGMSGPRVDQRTSKIRRGVPRVRSD